MANPYGITEVNIPGVIGAYRQGVNDRIANLEANRAEKKAIRDQEREDRMTELLARFANPQTAEKPNTPIAKGGDQTSVASPAPPARVGDAAAPVSPPAPVAPTPSPAASQPNIFTDHGLQQEFLSQLSVIDPKTAMEYAGKFSSLATEQRQQIAQHVKFVATEAYGLRQLPPGERAAALQSHAAQLRQMGVPDSMISNVDLSDAGLEREINKARDMEAIIDQSAPKPMVIPGGGTLHEYVAPSPYPNFDGQNGATQVQQPQTNGDTPFDYERTGIISEADAARMKRDLGPNGLKSFEAWKKKHNVVESKRMSNGQMAYLVNGKWYDNPEGR